MGAIFRGAPSINRRRVCVFDLDNQEIGYVNTSYPMFSLEHEVCMVALVDDRFTDDFKKPSFTRVDNAWDRPPNDIRMLPAQLKDGVALM